MRRITSPGKFEGCLVCDLYAYEETLMGNGDTLSDDCGGESYTRVDGPFQEDFIDGEYGFGKLFFSEKRFLQKQVGCILTESSDGFVSVSWYTDKYRLFEEWDSLEKDFSYVNSEE